MKSQAISQAIAQAISKPQAEPSPAQDFSGLALKPSKPRKARAARAPSGPKADSMAFQAGYAIGFSGQALALPKPSPEAWDKMRALFRAANGKPLGPNRSGFFCRALRSLQGYFGSAGELKSCPKEAAQSRAYFAGIALQQGQGPNWICGEYGENASQSAACLQQAIDALAGYRAARAERWEQALEPIAPIEALRQAEQAEPKSQEPKAALILP